MRVLLFWLEPPLTLVFMARCGFPACELASAVGLAPGTRLYSDCQLRPSEEVMGRFSICAASMFVCTSARSVCSKAGAAVTSTDWVAAATLRRVSRRRTAFTSTRTFSTTTVVKFGAEYETL